MSKRLFYHYCLPEILHNWLSHLDNPGNYIRTCFLDFCKAFDRIDHNIVISKLISLGVRRALIPWICSFLSGWMQSVKVNQSSSNWATVTAGLLQGTKLGPILFPVMIKDLASHSPLRSSNWFFVDDVTISQVVNRNASLGLHLNSIEAWLTSNNMKLQPKKCKDFTISFLRNPQQELFSTLSINSQPLEKVTCFKLLGVTLQNDLKWNAHVNLITFKVSKRLHILRVFRNSGIPAQDLLTIYISIIRSVLEYCCAVWSTSIPSYLSDKIEKVQRRALRILYPNMSYSAALATSYLPRLFDFRDILCKKVLNKRAIPSSRLNHLLPPTRFWSHDRELRRSNNFSVFKCRTDRFKNSFFQLCAYVLQ